MLVEVIENCSQLDLFCERNDKLLRFGSFFFCVRAGCAFGVACVGGRGGGLRCKRLATTNNNDFFFLAVTKHEFSSLACSFFCLSSSHKFVCQVKTE